MLTAIPLGLKHALESGECVLFIGAGIGVHMHGPDNKPIPDSVNLARELAVHFGIDTASEDLAKVSLVVENRKGRSSLEEFLKKRLANAQPDVHLRWLFSRRWRAIFTTNFDSCIQRAYELNEKPIQKQVTIASTPELVNYDPRLDVPIYHLHGALFGNRRNIVITENDYIKFREDRRMLFGLLKLNFATSTILYIGYRNQDPSWKLVLSEMAEEFFPSTLPTSYRVAPTTDPLDIEVLKSKGVETIDATFEQFATITAASVAGSDVDPEWFKGIKSTVPPPLREAFDKAPAAMTRLLSSWIYVNQASFADKPNVSAFLDGDRPNWALIGEKQYFERDIEDDIYDDALDYVTGGPKSPSVVLVLAPAGYGVTTVLMSTAVHLIKDGVTNVFVHKPGTPVSEGDVVYATSLSLEPTVFFVDDAADYGIAIQAALVQLRGNKKLALLVLGERLNEWRQRRAKIGGKEHILEPLSDDEINRLIDFLANHHALNKLESLKRDVQFSVIKQRHGKELLVAMKEATEGKGFDAILEDEFRGIQDSFSQSLYLAVCCFYQHGAYVRDAILAAVLRVDLLQLYARVKGILDGVVIFDCIDEAAGIYAGRARHRTVASIVWERCGQIGERSHILLSALGALNLNYRSDIVAFEQFVRSDHLIDGIHGFENKIQFFETACKKDPASPYVRQHYARMLLREKQPDLALTQIDEAFRINEKTPPRVLHHTRGTILAQLCMETQSEPIARRRLVQAEESFRKAMFLNPKDGYPYQSLASLYLGWAKRALVDAEAAEYLSKAEDIVGDGLRNVREREGLWIVTSEIQKWLGDTPSRVRALEQAVTTTPGAIVARYLLGRLYRMASKPSKAIDVLEPIIKGKPDEFRAFVEYALALLDLGKPIKEAIAILNISTTYGLNDARFVATFGGLLFLDRDFEAATRVFQESVRREFDHFEASAIHFRPVVEPGGKAVHLNGKVTVLRPRYAFVEVEGYPRFHCRSSKYSGIQLEVGLPVEFDLEFSAKGPTAARPRPSK